MPSSRAEHADAHRLLGELASIYDEGLDALRDGGLDRLAELLGRADSVLAVLNALPAESFASDEARSAWERTRDSHARLLGVGGNVRDELRVEIGRLRGNRAKIRGYGSRGHETGTRVRSDA